MSMSNDSSVLVTGGRGFIGRAVCDVMQRKGHSVLVLDLATERENSAQTLDATRQLQCDINDAPQLQQVFETEPIGGIIHLAAVLPTAAQRDPQIGRASCRERV